jgi:hypothetical protein
MADVELDENSPVGDHQLAVRVTVRVLACCGAVVVDQCLDSRIVWRGAGSVQRDDAFGDGPGAPALAGDLERGTWVSAEVVGLGKPVLGRDGETCGLPSDLSVASTPSEPAASSSRMLRS